MYCPNKLKLNKFKKVAIPSVRQMFRSAGFLNMPANNYTGDEEVEMPARKTDDMQRAYLMNRDALNEEEANKSE